MAASYTIASRDAWARMTRLLFRPFRIETWFVLGFAAFLSEQLFRPPFKGMSWREHGPSPSMPHLMREIAAFLLHPVWGPLVLAIVICSAAAALLFMWVSSRGKFIFLDDVLHERAAIVEPWKRFARLGNSLFGFWLMLTLLVAAIAIGITLPLLPALLEGIAHRGDWRVFAALFALWWVAAVTPLVVVAGATYLFLFEFVVPIMYRFDLGVLAAWGRFFGLLGQRPIAFIGYVVFYIAIRIATALLILIGGIATCCVGFVLIALPYVGAVILLPLEVWLRGLGPDFLRQLGPEWSITPADAPSPMPPGAAT